MLPAVVNGLDVPRKRRQAHRGMTENDHSGSTAEIVTGNVSGYLMDPATEQVHVGANPDLRTGSLIVGYLPRRTPLTRWMCRPTGTRWCSSMWTRPGGRSARSNRTSVRGCQDHVSVATPPAASVTTSLAARLIAATRRPSGDNAASVRETAVPDIILVRTDSAYRKVKLIVRRVERLKRVAATQSRGYAVADQVFADLIGGRLPHLPLPRVRRQRRVATVGGLGATIRAELIRSRADPPASVRGHSARPVAYPRIYVTTCAFAQASVNGNSGGITLFSL